LIACFDTSALVKLYVRENGSEGAVTLSRDCGRRVAHEVTYVEVRAALAAIRPARRAAASIGLPMFPDPATYEVLAREQ
jgi:predicted nucleic acid-binding protein